MKTYKEILNNKSIQQIRLITIHNILNDVDMNLLTEKAKQIFIKQNIQISDEQLSEYINYCAQQWLNAIRLTTIPQCYFNLRKASNIFQLCFIHNRKCTYQARN